MDKSITISQLLDGVYDLPMNYTVICNQVGNLSVLDKNEEFVGFIDFMTGEYVEV